MVQPSGKSSVFKFLLPDHVGVGILFGFEDNKDAAGGAVEVPED